MITVFYDGKCGLCSKEINHYRKIAPSNIFNWQDITESADELNQEGITINSWSIFRVYFRGFCSLRRTWVA